MSSSNKRSESENGNAPAVIAWDYQFAPNGQKARNLLSATGIAYSICEQPIVKPRPILLQLGITYRRIPVCSIGKDVYCDAGSFVAAVQDIFKDKALPTGPADHAFEAWGYRSFRIALTLVDANLITKPMQDDRRELFGGLFDREDYATLRPSGLAEMRDLLDTVENQFIGQGGPWINGEKVGVADIHAIWCVKWVLQMLGVDKEPGFSRDDFPKVYRWIEGLPAHTPENEAPKLGADEATEKLLASEYAAEDIGVDPNDPTGLKAGADVVVEANDDAEPGISRQEGKLVGLQKREVVLELDNGLRLHFPRIGFVLKGV